MALNPINLITSILGAPTSTYNGEIMTQYDASMLFNKQEAEKQRMWQEKMWNMQNEYNSPAAQMQRAREAGLNPGLIYGQPISEAPLASGGAEASAPSPQGIDNGLFRTVLQTIAELSSIPEQKDLLRAQAADAWSRVPLNNQRVLNFKEQVKNLQAQYDNLVKDLEVKDAQINLNNELGHEAYERAMKTANDNKLFLDTYSQRLQMFADQVSQQHYLTMQDRQEALTIGRQIEARISEMQASTKMMLASARLSDANRRMLKLQADNYDKTLANLKAMTDYYEALAGGQKVSNELKERFGSAQAVVDMLTQVLNSISPFAVGLMQVGTRSKGTQTVKTDANGNLIGTSTTTEIR